LTYPEHQESGGLYISDDYVAWDFYREENGKDSHNCAFLDTESMEIKEVIVSGLIQLNEEATIWTNKDKLEIVDPKNRWVVNAYDGLAEEFWEFNAEFGNKLLVTTCSEGTYWDRRSRMRIWKMGNPPVLLLDETLTLASWRVVKVDERFIVCIIDVYGCNRPTLWFISTETFEDFGAWSLRKHYKWTYDRGLLFQSPYNRKDNLIRILDVTTGFFNDVRLPVRNETRRSVGLMNRWASSNSRFMVIGWYYSATRELTNLSFYDLEAAKKPSSDCRCYPLYTLQFQCSVWSFVMDESLIAFYGKDEKGKTIATVLNFANFGFVERKTSDLEEKQEADGKMKIIFDPIVDSSLLDNC
jgi:hypothetical protein